MSARDELAAAVTLHLDDQGYEYATDHPDTTRRMGADIAAVAIAVGFRKPRTITTAEELDALPNGSVVVATLTSHHSGGWPIAYQRWEDGGWHRGARSASTHPDYIVPATVLLEASK